jgi:hypothetical protein
VVEVVGATDTVYVAGRTFGLARRGEMIMYENDPFGAALIAVVRWLFVTAFIFAGFGAAVYGGVAILHWLWRIT